MAEQEHSWNGLGSGIYADNKFLFSIRSQEPCKKYVHQIVHDHNTHAKLIKTLKQILRREKICKAKNSLAYDEVVHEIAKAALAEEKK